MADRTPVNLTIHENVVNHSKRYVSGIQRESLSGLVEKLLVKHLKGHGIDAYQEKAVGK